MLRLPNFDLPFVTETDANGYGRGAILLEEENPVAFLSKAFSSRNMGMSICGKELLALVLVITKWQHHLVGNYFIIKTNHKFLKFLLEQRLTTIVQHKWLTKLLGLDYEIQYKKGVENIVANVLTRRDFEASQSNSPHIMALTSV